MILALQNVLGNIFIALSLVHNLYSHSIIIWAKDFTYSLSSLFHTQQAQQPNESIMNWWKLNDGLYVMAVMTEQ